MSLIADGFSFHFPDALEAFVFDEKDPSHPHFNNTPMKKVDVVAEFAESYIFIEIKEFDDVGMYNDTESSSEEEKKERRAHLKWLKNYLKYKARDSLLGRFAEGKIDKDIHYICLLTNFDNATNNTIRRVLRQELPLGRAGRKWNRDLFKSCQVVNLDRWNTSFPNWPVSRI